MWFSITSSKKSFKWWNLYFMLRFAVLSKFQRICDNTYKTFDRNHSFTTVPTRHWFILSVPIRIRQCCGILVWIVGTITPSNLQCTNNFIIQHINIPYFAEKSFSQGNQPNTGIFSRKERSISNPMGSSGVSLEDALQNEGSRWEISLLVKDTIFIKLEVMSYHYCRCHFFEFRRKQFMFLHIVLSALKFSLIP